MLFTFYSCIEPFPVIFHRTFIHLFIDLILQDGRFETVTTEDVYSRYSKLKITSDLLPVSFLRCFVACGILFVKIESELLKKHC